MAARQKSKKAVGGPFLAAAVFCDSIVEGADGAMSAVRIVDQVTLTIPADSPPDVPSETNRLPVALWSLISFKRGSATKKHVVRLKVHSPSGEAQDIGEGEITFGDSQFSGANLRIRFQIAVKQGGLFWIDVKLDGKAVTRMPLHVSIVRAEQSQEPSKLKVIARGKPAKAIRKAK
jgi:hypothetical protein